MVHPVPDLAMAPLLHDLAMEPLLHDLAMEPLLQDQVKVDMVVTTVVDMVLAPRLATVLVASLGSKPVPSLA